MLYCATTASLCALEVLVHANALPTGRVVIAAEVPDTLSIERLNEADLPDDWKNAVATPSTKDIGTQWCAGLKTAILSVPSAVVPTERNYLVNPAHPDFAKIVFGAPEPFPFDPRLK